MTTYMFIKAISVLFLGCLIVTALLTPIVMLFARRMDAVDRGGYRKVHQGSMPLLGGLAVAVPLILLGLGSGIAGYFIAMNWKWLCIHHEEYWGVLLSFATSRSECMTLAIGGIGIVAVGLVDDVRGMRARYKLLGQIVVALFVCVSGYALTTVSIPFLGAVELGVGIGWTVTMLWIIGLINAFNLIDGIDGLAAGIALVGAAALVALSITQENMFVTFTGVALAGSLLAFLLYNFPPARIFLGDTGSMFLGYMLSTMSLMGAQKSEAAVILIAPMLALGFPIFETLVSILRRSLRGVPIFSGDNRHTHHRLLSKGYSQPRVVLTLCGTAALLAATAVISALVPNDSRWAWSPYLLYVGTLVSIMWVAGYLRPTTFESTMERRERNRIFQALGRYMALRLNAVGLPPDTHLQLVLCRQELGLRHIDVQIKEGPRLMISTDDVEYDGPRASTEMLLVKSADGRDVLVWYEFLNTPDDSRRQDVSLCLAGMFEQLRIEESAETGE
ncbi:glycosyltransferase family 4 protein [Candidatus Hydrogenedentota bacterium]